MVSLIHESATIREADVFAVKELSLRPYTGRLFYVKTKRAYEVAHRKLFKQSDNLSCAQDGRFYGGCGKDDIWTYLVYAEKPHVLAHELSHVLFHVFERCGINPTEAGNEPFCYMLSQLMLEAK